MKITRNVHFQLKDGKRNEFVQLFDSQVLPVLRQQTGFKDELTLLDTNQALIISFWDDRKNADMYHASVYPKLVEKLNSVIMAPPTVETYDVASTAVTA